jgi:CDP-diacylglycerol--glycerol-3-phosphate 3-phosphatidyltransferase
MTDRAVTKHSILPNAITLLRLLLTGPFVRLVYRGPRGGYFLALVVFTVAISTDVLDGYLARKLKCVTDLGNRLDVLADHILATISITILVSVGD